MGFRDLSGSRFGRLVAIERGENRNGKSRWVCKCDCGSIETVWTWNLTSGAQHQCHKCVTKSRIGKPRSHGLSRSRLYKIWADMTQRCKNPKLPNYKYYGGKGITVCVEWSTFDGFMAWALVAGYDDQMTIDRLDPCKNYIPENCRWVSRAENSRRCATARWDKHKGVCQ